MAIKLLAIKIRLNNNIYRFKIQGLKVSMYTDDGSFLLNSQSGLLQGLIEDVDHFSIYLD